MTLAHRLVAALLHAVTARHPYREAIRGDLEEEFDTRARDGGLVAARAWYAAEALRTTAALLRGLRVTPSVALRVAIAAPAAYLGVHWADQAAPEAIWWAGLTVTSTAGRVAALAWLSVAAALAGYLVPRTTREPLVGGISFLALTVAVATRYLLLAAPGPLWFHAAKAALLCLGAAAGISAAGLSSYRRAGITAS
jgi:hypothetical protein